jgi:predicted nucleotidyltransferase
MVAMRDIRKFARAIAREFKPRRIILFGSYAYGKPTRDSDVDFLIIFAGRGTAVDRSLEIRQRLHPGYPIDLITRTVDEVRRRVRLNDWFMRDAVEKGIVLYESDDTRVGRKGRR